MRSVERFGRKDCFPRVHARMVWSIPRFEPCREHSFRAARGVTKNRINLIRTSDPERGSCVGFKPQEVYSPPRKWVVPSFQSCYGISIIFSINPRISQTLPKSSISFKLYYIWRNESNSSHPKLSIVRTRRVSPNSFGTLRISGLIRLHLSSSTFRGKGLAARTAIWVFYKLDFRTKPTLSMLSPLLIVLPTSGPFSKTARFAKLFGMVVWDILSYGIAMRFGWRMSLICNWSISMRDLTWRNWNAFLWAAKWPL